jgi:hypothetical protein
VRARRSGRGWGVEAAVAVAGLRVVRGVLFPAVSSSSVVIAAVLSWVMPSTPIASSITPMISGIHATAASGSASASAR